jgi:alpha-L-rhamnosidase
VYVPSTNKEAIKENGNPVSSSKGVKVKGQENDYVVLDLGSGKYHFEVSK